MAEVAFDGTDIGDVGAPASMDAPAVLAPATFDKETRHVVGIERALSADRLVDDRHDADYVPDEIVEEVLPGYRSVYKRDSALRLYIKGEQTLSEIARAVDVPLRTVARWVSDGGWTKLLEQIAATLRRDEKARLAIIRVKNREKTMKEQLDIGAAINEQAKGLLDGELSPGQLKLAAEAAKLGSDMSNRALGIGESGDVDGDSKSAPQSATISLVNIFKDGTPQVEPRPAAVVGVQAST